MEVSAEAEHRVRELRQLPDRHPVAHRKREPSHRRRTDAVLHVPLNRTADRVGSIEHHHREPPPSRGTHDRSHGGRIGVIAGAHILEVDD